MRKWIALLLALVLCLGCLAGCSGATDKSSGTTSETASDAQQTDTAQAAAPQATASQSTDTSAAASFEGQTLHVSAFEGGYGAQFWRDIADAFEAAYPGVTVEIQSNPSIADIVRPQIIAGEFPDVYCSNSADEMYMTMINDHMVEDLSDIFEENALGKDVPLKDLLVDGILDFSRVKPYGDDTIAVAPLMMNINGMFYDKALFARNGWKVPKTWDEFFALGDVAKKQGISLMTYPGIYPSYLELLIWPAIASAQGADSLDAIMNYKEGSMSTPEVMEVLKNIAKIGTDGYLMPGTTSLNHTQSQSDFLLDKALFIPNGDWLPNEMAEAPRADGFEWALAPAFTLSADDESMYVCSTDGPIIPSSAKNKELAKEFIRFLYTDESVRALASATIVAPLKNVTEIAGDILPAEVVSLSSVSENATAISFNWAPLENSKIVLDDYVYAPITDVMNGSMTAEQWSANIEEMFVKINAGE